MKARTIRKKIAEKKDINPDKVVVVPDQIDEYNEAAIKEMVSKTPEVRFKHASYFTDDEDKIIAASIFNRVQYYKIASSLRCSINTLKKHIENTPVLMELVKQAKEKECGEVREAVDDLVKMRHPQVVMWRAKQLMPAEYGDTVETEEDDTRIIIGAIPEDLIAEGDRVLALAAEKPPEVGLSALLDPRTKKDVEKAVEEAKKEKEKENENTSDEEKEKEDEEVDIDEEFLSDEGFDDFDGGSDLGF